MRGRVRGIGGSDTEEVVGERLRAILAAANSRSGWVPGRVAEAPQPVEQAQPPEQVRPDEPVRDRAERRARVRWEPSRPGALAMCLVAVLAALLSAGLTWWTRPEPASPDARPLSGSLESAIGTGPSATPHDETEPGVGAGSADQLVVSVIGQVRQPGLVTVEDGARVADAVNAAGGALPEADLSTINLARLVVDGEQIAVGIPGSELPGGGDPTTADGLMNLNTASATELEGLPGIGPVLAQRIVDFRGDNGGFTAVEQLREVSGIGPTVYEQIVDLVTV